MERATFRALWNSSLATRCRFDFFRRHETFCYHFIRLITRRKMFVLARKNCGYDLCSVFLYLYGNRYDRKRGVFRKYVKQSR